MHHGRLCQGKKQFPSRVERRKRSGIIGDGDPGIIACRQVLFRCPTLTYQGSHSNLVATSLHSQGDKMTKLKLSSDAHALSLSVL